MRQLAILVLALMICSGALAEGVSIPSSGVLQVGGDFGRNWLDNFFAMNQPPVQADPVNDLWNWGGTPKGKIVVNGSLVPAKNLSVERITGEWLGEYPIGQPVQLNSSPYASAVNGSAPLSPLYLSSDPWIRAQQLGRIVQTPTDYQEL